VNLAFASDKPVEHWFGNLQLSMKPGAMRTERLKSGAPLLMDHNSRDQVGVVEEYSIGKKPEWPVRSFALAIRTR
jgi:hypothetical protein